MKPVAAGTRTGKDEVPFVRLEIHLEDLDVCGGTEGQIDRSSESPCRQERRVRGECRQRRSWRALYARHRWRWRRRNWIWEIRFWCDRGGEEVEKKRGAKVEKWGWCEKWSFYRSWFWDLILVFYFPSKIFRRELFDQYLFRLLCCCFLEPFRYHHYPLCVCELNIDISRVFMTILTFLSFKRKLCQY